MVDPKAQPKTEYQNKTSPILETQVFSGGYVDWRGSDDVAAQPTRESDFDDIIFFLKQTGVKEIQVDNLHMIATKLVNAHHMLLIEYLGFVLQRIESFLEQRKDNDEHRREVIDNWPEAWHWNRKMVEYRHDIDMAVAESKNFQQRDSERPSDWANDSEYLQRQISDSKERMNAVLASIAGLNAYFEGKRATNINRTIEALTALGVLFLPLSFTAALFSMNEKYLPGGPLRWVYPVLAIPILGLLSCGVWMWVYRKNLKCERRKEEDLE